jgi:uncharacterized membrane protein YeaQ/YmgE (transglycosylase-associated protein family)
MAGAYARASPRVNEARLEARSAEAAREPLCRGAAWNRMVAGGPARSGAAIPGPIREAHMNWIVTLVVGGIIGWLASILMKTNKQMGIIANVIVGIIGSSLGFWLAGVLGLAAYGVIVQWAVAVAGAALLIYLLKALGFFK